MAFLMLSTSYGKSMTPLPVIDSNDAPFPKRFRVMDQNDVQMIGSGQFSKPQLLRIQDKIKEPLIIIDLRQESHGFLNDIAISWYGNQNWENRGKSDDTINTQQTQYLQNLLHQRMATFFAINSKTANGVIKSAHSHNIPVKTVYSEQTLAEELGLRYQRFFVADHSPPSADQVRAFSQFLTTLPAHSWVYFHCRGGSGRTSTFMTLYAIYKQGKTRSFEDIIEQQIRLGGADLRKLPDPQSYKYIPAKKRFDVLKNYYASIHKSG
jgi:protein tyrosine/serine phosphatase